jgi:hypothetical protein
MTANRPSESHGGVRNVLKVGFANGYTTLYSVKNHWIIPLEWVNLWYVNYFLINLLVLNEFNFLLDLKLMPQRTRMTSAYC